MTEALTVVERGVGWCPWHMKKRFAWITEGLNQTWKEPLSYLLCGYDLKAIQTFQKTVLVANIHGYDVAGLN